MFVNDAFHSFFFFSVAPPLPTTTRLDDVRTHRVYKRTAPKIANNKKHYYAAAAADGRCMARVQSALGEMLSTPGTKGGGNRRHTNGGSWSPQPPQPSSIGFMDLSGYALHQRLRTAPGAEMYVTGMRAKVMPANAGGTDAVGAESVVAATGDNRNNNNYNRGYSGPWARVDECRYDPLGNVLEARMRFGRTLMVSGSVKLHYGGNPLAADTGCDMTLRLRPRAGLGFTAVPLTMPEKSPPNRLTATPTMTIRTTAKFLDAEQQPATTDPAAAAYVSVHSYNCVGGALAGFPGRERPTPVGASSDRFEQFASAEDELQLQTGGGIDIDLDDDLDGGSHEVDNDDDNNGRKTSSSSESTDGRRGNGQRPVPSSSSSSDRVAASAVPSFGDAGFVGSSTAGPEPRLRRIQYHMNNNRPQHPLLAVVATGPAAVTNDVHDQQKHDQLLMEMEDVFVRGVRSLLAKHMERTLKPVLKDSLMANMGYTVSYGRR